MKNIETQAKTTAISILQDRAIVFRYLIYKELAVYR